jgi:hypothetical protein
VFATEPRRAQSMISQALEAGVPFAWFTAGPCWPGSPGWTRARRSLKEIEPVNDTLTGRLDLGRHGGRTTRGLQARIVRRLLALAVCV